MEHSYARPILSFYPAAILLLMLSRSGMARESVDPSQWKYTIFPAGDGSRMVVEHNGQWLMTLASSVADPKNVGKQLAFEAVVESARTAPSPQLILRKLKLQVNMPDQESLDGIVPGCEVWLAGKLRKAKNGGVYFEVAQMERLVPASRRFSEADKRFRKKKDWKALLLLAEHIEDFASFDPTRSTRFKETARSICAKAIRLKILDPNATDQTDPNDLVARAEELMSCSLNRSIPRKLVRKALELDPDNPKAVQLQPILLPELELETREDGTLKWVDSNAASKEENTAEGTRPPEKPAPAFSKPVGEKPGTEKESEGGGDAQTGGKDGGD